jgi:hypothetical protein
LWAMSLACLRGPMTKPNLPIFHNRAGAPQRDQASELGPLADLPGTWVGSGFNLVSLPNFDLDPPSSRHDFRLLLNATRETLEFTPVGGKIPNRGSKGQHGILALEDAKQGQNIVSTIVLQISTSATTELPNGGGGVLNIPFLQKNANATRLDATFWIETVERDDHSRFMQLQYTQTVILNFLDIDWPHISVGTLIKQ